MHVQQGFVENSQASHVFKSKQIVSFNKFHFLLSIQNCDVYFKGSLVSLLSIFF